MGEAGAIAATDRLPWLDTVEGKEAEQAGLLGAIGGRRLAGFAAIVLVCAGLFWLGRMNGMATIGEASNAIGSVAEVDLRRLPYPRLTEPEPVLRVDAPPLVIRSAERPATASLGGRERGEALAAAPARRQIIPLNSAWSGQRRTRWVTDGSKVPAGQSLQLGSYDSATQASESWTQLADRYPLLGSMAVAIDSPAPGAGKQEFRLLVVAESKDKAELACQILRLDGRDCTICR